MDFAYAPIGAVNLFAPFVSSSNIVLSTKATNAYFALLEMHAIRAAAARTCGEWKALFTIEEVAALIEASRHRALRAVLELQEAGLVRFSEREIEFKPTDIAPDVGEMAFGKRSPRRIIPVPRTVLRFLARCPSHAMISVLVGYMMRGLSLKHGEVNNRGTAKVSWFGALFGFSRRAINYARSALIDLGLITDDSLSTQRKLNRTGAYFEIDCTWKPQRPKLATATAPESDAADRTTEFSPVIQSPLSDREQELTETSVSDDREGEYPTEPPQSPSNGVGEIRYVAPPPPADRTNFAPPKEDRDLPYGRKKDQELGVPTPGLSMRGVGEEAPQLSDVKLPDLLDFSRTYALYRQAVDVKLVPHSEHSLLQWVAAAVRAKSAVTGDRVRIFMGIVRQNLWHHITQAEEDRARQAIARYLPMGMHEEPTRKSSGTAFVGQLVQKLVGRG